MTAKKADIEATEITPELIDDDFVVLTQDVEASHVFPGEKTPRTWFLGGPGTRVRRADAEAFAPEGSWKELGAGAE